MTKQLIDALAEAESFIAGFEGDETQEGVDAILENIRAAIKAASASPVEQFKALLAGGLTQGEVLSALHDADPEVKNHDGTIEAARSNYADDDCEIDAKPLLSVADGGVWVSAWVWVRTDHDEDGRSCDNCGETLQDGSGICITCGQEA